LFVDVLFQGVTFAKCPAEDLPEVSLKYSVSAVPTFLLLRGGSLLDRVDGANAAELTKKINSQVIIFLYIAYYNIQFTQFILLQNRPNSFAVKD
jgi:hypothetical protein